MKCFGLLDYLIIYFFVFPIFVSKFDLSEYYFFLSDFYYFIYPIFLARKELAELRIETANLRSSLLVLSEKK